MQEVNASHRPEPFPLEPGMIRTDDSLLGGAITLTGSRSRKMNALRIMIAATLVGALAGTGASGGWAGDQASVNPPVSSVTSKPADPARVAAAPVLAPGNPSIDMAAYLKVSQEAAASRVKHRVTEAEFIRMSHETGTLILDARSREKYEMLHVKGAINLSFPDIAIESLARTIPDKGTKILIYCNNNFLNAPGAFPSKLPSASLNLSTFIALYNYGYRNVYELGPTIDIQETKIEFEPPLEPKH